MFRYTCIYVYVTFVCLKNANTYTHTQERFFYT